MPTSDSSTPPSGALIVPRDKKDKLAFEREMLGLYVTRKRIGTGLAEAFTEECDHCHGSDYRFQLPQVQ